MHAGRRDGEELRGGANIWNGAKPYDTTEARVEPVRSVMRVRPSILVEIENPTKYNYMYIPDFGRYYFIKEITSVRTNLWRLDCEVDVLKSYADKIKTLTVIIDKNKDYSKTNQYLNDGSFVIENKNTIEIKNFTNGFNDESSYVLITAGA